MKGAGVYNLFTFLCETVFKIYSYDILLRLFSLSQ